MRFKKTIVTTLLLAASLPLRALEIDPLVMPEINLGGRAVATAGYRSDDALAAGPESEGSLDVADSSLLFGFSKYLFDSTRYGFGVVGFKLPEDGTDLRDDIYLHEAHAGVGGKRWEVKLGRSRLGNTLLAFPTLRDDDLLAFTHVGNGLANAEAEEYRQFGNLVEGRYWVTPVVELDAALTARTETDLAGDKVSGEQFNGARLGIAYDVPEAIKFARGLRYAALRFDGQRVQDLGAGLPKGRMNALIAAAALNLSDNPEATWNLDLQAIANAGVDVASLASEPARARAKSNAVVAALRYGHRPALQTRWQAAVTLAWKEYGDFADARAVAVVPSYGYRLGSGVELLAQYAYTKYDGALAQAVGLDATQQLQVGLLFSFDHTFNETVGERQGILNLEHNMFDLGPMGGGH
jgi:hypothetical protein